MGSRLWMIETCFCPKAFKGGTSWLWVICRWMPNLKRSKRLPFFVWVGAPKGGDRGWVRGVQPQNRALCPIIFFAGGDQSRPFPFFLILLCSLPLIKKAFATQNKLSAGAFVLEGMSTFWGGPPYKPPTPQTPLPVPPPRQKGFKYAF